MIRQTKNTKSAISKNPMNTDVMHSSGGMIAQASDDRIQMKPEFNGNIIAQSGNPIDNQHDTINDPVMPSHLSDPNIIQRQGDLPIEVAEAEPDELLNEEEIDKIDGAKRLVGGDEGFDGWSKKQIEFEEKKLLSGIKGRPEEAKRRLKKLKVFRKTISKLLKREIKRDNGIDLLTLANIIYHEASVGNAKAMEAVGYAWLNRTGGEVSGNLKAEITDYITLNKRWFGYLDLKESDKIANQLEFMEKFPIALEVAFKLMNMTDKERAKSDPTDGATHWVSIKSLDPYSKKKHEGKDYYKRTVGKHKNKAFPTWATDDEKRIEKMKEKGQIGDDYEEMELEGVPGDSFRFYKDVNYSRK